NRILFFEADNEERNGHPLRRMFSGGDQLVDLNRFPEYFHGSAPASFMRLDFIRSLGVFFDDRVQPNFEDGHFCSIYLLGCDQPKVGFLESAKYLYRKRADQTSTLQNSLRNPMRFNSVPRFGYLDALQIGARKFGRAPEWLQNFILYELSYYFSSDEGMSNAQTAAVGETAAEFVNILSEIAPLFDDIAVNSFAIRRFDRAWRDIMIHAFQEEPWHTPYVVLRAFDESKDLVQLKYRYTGDAPAERVLSRGKQIKVKDSKVRALRYFEHDLLKERLLWVPAGGSLCVMLDDRLVELRGSSPGALVTRLRPSQLRARFTKGNVKRSQTKPGSRLGTMDRLTIRLADSWPVRRYFAGAWVIMDRIDNADDSGERLFRYLRRKRRDVNAWFVVETGTPDWSRLKADGYRRVVPYGSLRWRLLMLDCAHLISSHIDEPVHRPPEILRLREATWKFTFLQHGVIKDDLSRWLNKKMIHLFITSTVPEHESIVGDNTPYVFTTKEVKMLGLPRFDRLREVGASVSTPDRDLILLAPTWRNWLTPLQVGGSPREQLRDDFLESQFAQEWLGILKSEALADLARKHGLSIGFLPHPNLQKGMAGLSIPDHIVPLRFEGNDVQRYFARAAVMVTDYSSMAFNSAYIDRPVVYFQFDHERVRNGGHLGRAGYFDYRRDGFGPVTETIDETVDSIREVVENGKQVPSEYQERINRTFTQRDGRCCERVVRAIESL
ncbi:MAG: CDP-glycerol glycerophosphotransferase family protein, partial [Chloroflexi bacterium]|nr:CDP-glycerol glycerophosphotransferase family protein [Chloroflexota bacterium]